MFCKTEMEELQNVFDGVKQMPSKQVAFYLLRNSASICRILYIMRVTRREMIEQLISNLIKVCGIPSGMLWAGGEIACSGGLPAVGDSRQLGIPDSWGFPAVGDSRQ